MTPSADVKKNQKLACSFCGKSQDMVHKFIAGPGVFICDQCIDLCNEIIIEELSEDVDLDATGVLDEAGGDVERLRALVGALVNERRLLRAGLARRMPPDG